MTTIDSSPYNDKLKAAFYEKVLQDNIRYRNEHGVGPYEYNGRFADRVIPYLDAGYWMAYDEWIRDEIGAMNAAGFKELVFETDEAAAWFMLKWS